MVYNALKMFMESNPDMFEEVMRQYKQRRIKYVVISAGAIVLTTGLVNRK